jgi:transcriptional regulator with XRE-family HTH domain
VTDAIAPQDATGAGRQVTAANALESVGKQLRDARLAAGITLREMARRVGISPSMVSQVELGRTKPSVGTLYSMASELSVTLGDLMPTGMYADEDAARGIRVVRKAKPSDPVRDASSQGPVQRAADRHELKMEGATWGRLTADHDPDNDFLHVVYQPGGESCPEDGMIHHRGREYGYVITGTLRVQVGFAHYDLTEGDSITFESMTPHRLHNPFEVATTSIWMVVGRGGTPVL